MRTHTQGVQKIGNVFAVADVTCEGFPLRMSVPLRLKMVAAVRTNLELLFSLNDPGSTPKAHDAIVSSANRPNLTLQGVNIDFDSLDCRNYRVTHLDGYNLPLT